MRVPADPFAGKTVAESGIYERTGCRIIAIEDDSGLSSTIDPQRRLSGDERLVIVGTDSSVKTFRRTFDVAVTDVDT
jgi:K+/H+ antiporter YhaU regulatory subunit KhtT